MANEHEIAAREAKARKIADALQAAGIKAAAMATASETSWQLAAALAETKAPSENTRAWVVDMMRSAEAAEARIAAIQDPFAGFTIA